MSCPMRKPAMAKRVSWRNISLRRPEQAAKQVRFINRSKYDMLNTDEQLF
jgi:hypothetical protein